MNISGELSIIMVAPRGVGKTSILALVMDFNNMRYMPANYTRFFVGIQCLVVRNSRVKYLTNADFLGLKSLTLADFRNNEIEYLPEKLFQGVSTVLESVSFSNNRITNIGVNFISYLPGLNSSLLKNVLPVFIHKRLQQAFREYGKKMWAILPMMPWWLLPNPEPPPLSVFRGILLHCNIRR